MSEMMFPAIEGEGMRSPERTTGPSIVTLVGLVEGDVLTYLDTHRATPLRRLARELEWPSAMVFMGVGALIRQGLARGVQHDLEVIVEPAS